MAIVTPLPSLPCPATRAHLMAAHFAWLHPKGSVGRGWIGTKVVDEDGERFEGETVELSELLTCQSLPNARYASLNRFWGRRRSGECLKSVAAIGLDFDYNKPGLPFEGWKPEDVRDVLIEGMAKAGIPLPSIWVASGRNLQAQYGCDGAKAAAWLRACAIYDALHGPDLATNGMPKAKRRHADPEMDRFDARMLPLWRLFKDAGLDRVCRDAARVMRLVGAVHAETGRMARLLSPSSLEDATRYSFHALADAILPVARHELLERRKARAEAKAAAASANDNPAPAKARRHAGPGGRWVGILRDLHLWRDGMGGPPKGKRELWLFLTANATAHVRGGRREDWAAELAPLAGLSEREAFRALGTLDRRQRRHEAGETDEHEGVEQSALYNHGAALIVDLLDIQVEQAERFGLRSLYPGGGKAMTPAERQEARRRRKGVKAYDEGVNERIWEGIAALSLRGDGMSLSAIAAEFGCCRDTLITYMRDASHLLGLGGAIDAETWLAHCSPSPATEVEIEAVDGASRYIVGSASREARPASEPEATAPGTVRVHRWTRVFATVATATGSWEWLRVEDVWGRGFSHHETRLLTDPDAVSAADEALAARAFEELAAAASRPVPRAPARERRRPGRNRPAAIQAAPATVRAAAPLAPLDAASDRAREVELYKEASGGRSSSRDRYRLVSA